MLCYVSCIANDDFDNFRSVLIFSNNSVVNVDVHINADNYLNCKCYDHNFQSNLRVMTIILNQRSCFQSLF